MNTIRSIALFLAVIFISLFVFPQNLYSQAARQQIIRDVSISVEPVDTPIWKVINVMEKGGIKPRKWLQIEVDFTTGASNKANESLDNVTAEFEMLLPTSDAPNASVVLISGKAAYWAIALDGQVHHLIAFVPPRILEKFSGSSRMSKSDAKKIETKVIFKYNDAEIATGYQVARQSTAAQVAERFAKAKTLPNLVRQKDAILGQDKTPWSVLNYDYFEQVNPDVK
ncbi:MAG TPA: hypothetical protein DCZ94_00295 [Lentisphaeria bacterium]|nr:MAG: hypothetical protein A2X48_18790 [Lentisphaerae bacterium GWF2_49_21]HBC85371.1 hypothetical protein [Lentisphaeria bacterium]